MSSWSAVRWGFVLQLVLAFLCFLILVLLFCFAFTATIVPSYWVGLKCMTIQIWHLSRMGGEARGEGGGQCQVLCVSFSPKLFTGSRIQPLPGVVRSRCCRVGVFGCCPHAPLSLLAVKIKYPEQRGTWPFFSRSPETYTERDGLPLYWTQTW